MILRKWGPYILGLILLIIVGKGALTALATEETRIRWLLEELEEYFDAGRSGALVRCFSDEFRDIPTGTSRDLLHGGFAHFFFRARTSDGRLLYQVDVASDSLHIELDEDQQCAAVECEARFLRTDTDPPELSWHILVRAQLRLTDGEWLVTRTDWETLAGDRIIP